MSEHEGLSQDGPIQVHRWEEFCRDDKPRNLFVIPEILRVIRELGVELVVDVGAATGYIARNCLKSGAMARWVLVERNSEMLSWLREHLKDERIGICEATFPEDAVREFIKDRTLVLASYTPLEFDLERVSALADFVPVDGWLLIFLPDVLEDVLNEEPQSMSQFLAGGVRLIKYDRLRDKEIPFYAQRIEVILQALLGRGLVLAEFKSCSLDGHQHYALLFRRPGLST